MDGFAWLLIIVLVIWLAGPPHYEAPPDWHNGNWREP